MLKSFYLHGPIFDFLPEGVQPLYSIPEKAACYTLENNPQDSIINFSKVKVATNEIVNIQTPIFFLDNFEFIYPDMDDLSSIGRKSLTRFADAFVNQVNASTGGSLKNKKVSVVFSLVNHKKYKFDTRSLEYRNRKKEFYSGKGLGVGLMLISEPVSLTNKTAEDLCSSPRTLEDL